MSEVSTRLGHITTKLEQVSGELKSLRVAKEDLKAEVAALKRRLADEQSRSAALLEENERIKLAKTVVTASGDKAVMKYKVNEMVKEIDKCIALLNR